jgi:SAM-dependent methyltransferase
VRVGTREGLRGGRFAWKRAARLTARAARFFDVSARLGARIVARAVVITARRAHKLHPKLGYARNLLHYRHEEELRHCPACSSPRLSLLAPLPLNARPRGRRYGFITGCRRCGLLFANPQPTAERLRAFYTPDGEWGAARQQEPPRAKGSAAPYVVELFTPARHWIDPERPAPGASVFEFGCGDGELLDALQAFGWVTCGLDPGDKRAFARHRELDDIPGVPTFDVAIVHHVLEHVASPLAILQALHLALKPDGLVVVSVPRLDTLHRHRDFRYCINPRTHIVAYSRDCLATLLAFAGFDAIDGSPPPDAPADDWFVLRRLRMIGRKSDRPSPGPGHPLRSARRALAAYYAQQPAWDGWRAHLPVRTRAALAELHRSRRVS